MSPLQRQLMLLNCWLVPGDLMAKPLYIICAESAVEDKRTNLLSLFNILEKFTAQVKVIRVKGDKIIRRPLFRFRSVAVWMREESDPWDQEFEAQLQLILPPDETEITGAPEMARFKFKEGRPLQRISMEFEGDPPFKGPGILRVISRIRPVGSEEWLQQEYPIIVEFEEAKPDEENEPQPKGE